MGTAGACSSHSQKSEGIEYICMHSPKIESYFLLTEVQSNLTIHIVYLLFLLSWLKVSFNVRGGVGVYYMGENASDINVSTFF